MPEGHSIHRLAHAFDELFGRMKLEASSPQGRFSAGAEILDGMVLRRAEAYGKQLFLGLGGTDDEPDKWLRVHLGLYGAWTFTGAESFTGPHAIGAPRRRIAEREQPVAGSAGHLSADGRFIPPAPRGAVRLRLIGEDGCADLTGPSACEVITGPEMGSVIGRLGPDPLRDARPTGVPGVRNSCDDGCDEFLRRVRARRVAIGALVMDQAVCAGVGNIFRAESLFLAGLDPHLPGRDLPEESGPVLWSILVRLMQSGVDTGKINATGDPDEPFYVYHRTGQGCMVCSGPIAEAKMGGRRLFWCPHCQPA